MEAKERALVRLKFMERVDWEPSLSPIEKTVIRQLLWHDFGANNQKVSPSNTRLATRACCSRRTVIRAVQQAEDLGWIGIQHRKGTSNLYHVNYESLKKFCELMTAWMNSKPND